MFTINKVTVIVHKPTKAVYILALVTGVICSEAVIVVHVDNDGS